METILTETNFVVLKNFGRKCELEKITDLVLSVCHLVKYLVSHWTDFDAALI